MAGPCTRSRLRVTINAIVVATILTAFSADDGWRETYPGQFAAAEKFYEDHQVKIDSAAHTSNLDVGYLYSVVAPEVGHYLASKDAIETAVVELFYVQMGSDHGNFSIGPFQMQPAFAERVEHYVRQFKLSQFYQLSFPKSEQGRAKRISMIKSLSGSLTYLCAFYAIIERTHFSKGDFQGEQKLALAAAAYNSGFERKIEELNRQVEIKSFPRFGNARLSYSHMAIEFQNYFQSTR